MNNKMEHERLPRCYASRQDAFKYLLPVPAEKVRIRVNSTFFNIDDGSSLRGDMHFDTIKKKKILGGVKWAHF